MLLALLWASLSNVSATAFWSVAFLLLPEHAEWRRLLSDELSQPASHVDEAPTSSARKSADPASAAQRRHLQRAGAAEDSVLQCCIDEAIRLRAESARPTAA